MPRVSYANVTATIALVVALSAGAYAAGLGRNDVNCLLYTSDAADE